LSIFEDIRDSILKQTPTFTEGDLEYKYIESLGEEEAETESADDQGIDHVDALQNILSEIRRAKKEGRDVTQVLQAATDLLEEMNMM
jgi:CHASE3 domain sensor protein